MRALLEVRALEAGYGDARALHGVSLSVPAGAALAIVGANGAGKSTLLKAVAGLLPARPDAVLLDGEPVGGLPAPEIVRRGIALVPEGRRLFASLTVEENLQVGAWSGRAAGRRGLDGVYALFPALAARRRAAATALSGGQQQMVAIGRALMSGPRLLLCDEISLGLAPVVVRDIYAALPAIRAEGTGVVLVEQDVARALAAADRVACLREGRVTLEGAPAALSRAAVHAAYFGG